MVWPGGTTDKPRGWGFSKQWKAIKNRSSKLSYQDFVSCSRLNGADIPSILHICVVATKLLAYAVIGSFSLEMVIRIQASLSL